VLSLSVPDEGYSSHVLSLSVPDEGYSSHVLSLNVPDEGYSSLVLSLSMVPAIIFGSMTCNGVIIHLLKFKNHDLSCSDRNHGFSPISIKIDFKIGI
jgi:hypothetical protein